MQLCMLSRKIGNCYRLSTYEPFFVFVKWFNTSIFDLDYKFQVCRDESGFKKKKWNDVKENACKVNCMQSAGGTISI